MIKIVRCVAIVLSYGLYFWAATSPAGATPRGTMMQLAPASVIPQAEAPADSKKPEGVVVAQGKIKAISRPPKPGSVPYRDAVIAIHLVDVEALEGKIGEKEILVFLWGMRDKKWTAAAGYVPGQTIKLTVQPWDEVMDQFGGYNRIELEDEAIFLLEPYWGEIPTAHAPD
jgi:hypothetical protein